MICCPVCSRWFKRGPEDKYFCSPGCKTEALELLDAPDDWLVKKTVEYAEDRIAKRIWRETHHLHTIIDGLEEQVADLKEQNASLTLQLWNLEK